MHLLDYFNDTFYSNPYSVSRCVLSLPFNVCIYGCIVNLSVRLYNVLSHHFCPAKYMKAEIICTLPL